MTVAVRTARSTTSRHARPAPPLPPPVLRTASGGRPAATGASGWPWIGPRGGARDKLCVRMPEALRERLDDALADLGSEPDLVPGGTSTLRSLNNVIAFACDGLCTDLDDYREELRARTDGPDPADGQRAEPLHRVRDGAPRAGLAAAVRPVSMYHAPWQDGLTTARCQLTLRIPVVLSTRLREALAWLRVRPALPPDLAGVGGLTDLVGLACHRLCTSVETMPDPRRRP